MNTIINNLICNVPCSIGELYDKYSILCIKLENISDAQKKEHIINELSQFTKLIEELPYFDLELFLELKKINSILWKIEDDIRIKEKNNTFDTEFINLARSVYKTNDERFNIKNKINLKYNSNIFEVKSYEKYC